MVYPVRLHSNLYEKLNEVRAT